MAYDSEKAETHTDPGSIECARERFRLCVESEQPQRLQDLEALKFQVPELQWRDTDRSAREGTNEGGVVSNPRPIMSISKLDQPIQLVLNQAKASKLGVDIQPVSPDADDGTAEVMKGLYSRIERDSPADDARMLAFERAVKVGWGVYRVNTKWDEHAAPETFDQEVVIEPILHQDSVYFDPACQRKDKSDAEYAFVISWIPYDTFCRDYPGTRASVAGGNPLEWETLTREAPNWVRMGDGKKRDVLVAEYMWKEHKKETLCLVKAGKGKGTKVVTLEQATEGKLDILQQRDRDLVTVHIDKITGFEIIKKQLWAGQFIPLVFVTGRRLIAFDGRVRYVGMINPAMDSQRLYNTAASNLVERMNMEPKAPWVMPKGMDDGVEREWDLSNVKSLSVLHYEPIVKDGVAMPPPQRAPLELKGMSMALQALQWADDALQGTTAIYDPSLGREVPRDKSGRAIQALQEQSNAATSHWMQNLADAVAYEARVGVDIFPVIYGEPGRVLQILGKGDKVQPIVVGASYALNEQGRPVPAQPGAENAKFHDFKKGAYSVAVSVGPGHQTRMQEGREELSRIIEAAPALLPVIGDYWVKYLGIPDWEAIHDRLQKWGEMQFPGIMSDDENGLSPAAAQAKVQALEAQLQQRTAELQAAVSKVESDFAKQQATLQKSAMDNETKERMAAEKNRTDVILERMQNNTDLLIAQMKAALETLKQERDMAHDVGMASGGGTTETLHREEGREEGAEREDEESQGRTSESSSESSAETAPPQGEA